MSSSTATEGQPLSMKSGLSRPLASTRASRIARHAGDFSSVVHPARDVFAHLPAAGRIAQMTRLLYTVLANSAVALVINTFVWFAVTFWVYLQTRSVIATSFMAGIYLATVAVSGFFLGSLVDRYPKKTSMMISSVLSLILYGVASVLVA